jgi:hypoxanthine phosphoribosyltransferase
VASQIRKNEYSPTVVIGLTRGGWVPARLICDHLHVKKLYAVKTEHWGVTATQDGKALLTQECAVDVKNEKVLIMDDITDTGESLALALSHLTELNPKVLKSATLLHIAHSKMEPDFYAEEVPESRWTWFIFPWNLHEDMRTILPKTLYEARSVPQIQEAFKNQFMIDVPDALIRRTLKDLKEMGKVEVSGHKWRTAE